LSGENFIGMCDIDAPFEVTSRIIKEGSYFVNILGVKYIGFEFQRSHSVELCNAKIDDGPAFFVEFIDLIDNIIWTFNSPPAALICNLAHGT
jgi:hypothetical protein